MNECIYLTRNVMDFCAYIEAYYGITANICVNASLDSIYIPKVPGNGTLQRRVLDFWTMAIVLYLKKNTF